MAQYLLNTSTNFFKSEHICTNWTLNPPFDVCLDKDLKNASHRHISKVQNFKLMFMQWGPVYHADKVYFVQNYYLAWSGAAPPAVPPSSHRLHFLPAATMFHAVKPLVSFHPLILQPALVYTPIIRFSAKIWASAEIHHIHRSELADPGKLGTNN